MQFRKPTPQAIDSFLDRERNFAFTYPGVGATASSPPTGYVVDRTRAQLGSGGAVFQSAVDALRRWDHFKLGWIETHPADVPLETGAVVAVLARMLGTWWLNSARIVYVVDQQAPPANGIRQFGYAYGTLPGHAESGEERFLIEMLPDGTVWYDIIAFSRPRHLLARLGRPFVRVVQKQFARDSVAAMRRALAAR